MRDFKEARLIDITIGNGTYGIAAPAVPKDNNKYTYLRITDINDDGSLNFSDLKSVDDPKANKYLLKPNDIVFARTGNSTGRSYFYDGSAGELVYAGFLIKFSLDSHKVNPKILKYYTHSKNYYDWVASFDSGATRGNINAKTFAEMPITLPPRNIQDKIVAILSALDEKIETNRKINARLEELAQALFKSWFIDFEPFGGQMPEDWKIVKMSEVIEDIAAGPFGSKLPKACFTSEGTPIIDGANLKERIVDETFSKFVSPSKSNELGRAVAHRNDFVVTISGTIGQIAYIYGTSKFSDYLVSQRQFRFSLKKDKVNKHYISLLFANNIGKQKILSFGNQVGVPALSQPLKNFKNVEIILPGMIIQNSFGEIIESIDSLICKNKQESARLTEMRDTLLPKLMSGELIPE